MDNGRLWQRGLLLWAVGIAAVLGLVVVLVWFQPQTLLFDTTVNESLPGMPAAAVDQPAPAVEQSAPAGEESTPEQMADGGLTVLAQGEFTSIAHETSGTAQIVELPDGSRLLHFSGLATDNGPDLRVYLSTAPADGPPDAIDDDFIDLGALKGNLGDQNYEIPDDVDVSRFASVSVWCRRFSVGFGVAPLQPPT